MKIVWLGHSGFRIEIGGAVLLVDPWLTGNPMFDAARRPQAVAGATHILLTHGHGDHSADTVALAKELDVPAVGIFDLMSHWEKTEEIKTVGFNKGGTVRLAASPSRCSTPPTPRRWPARTARSTPAPSPAT
jgi:L-ascorbate metabolism protein UlaG (beta-lactamase superfamily)